MISLREIISEYSDEEKQQMGIPPDAEARGGKWFVGDIYVGKVVDGKFVKASYETPTASWNTDTVNLMPIDDIEDYPAFTDPNSDREPVVDLSHDNWPRATIESTIKQHLDQVDYRAEYISIDHSDAVRDKNLIEQDPDVQESIDEWQSTSVWAYSAPKRERIFERIDDFLKKTNTTVTQTLYRGIHFASNNTYNKAFVKTVFNKFKTGTIISLPPSGFSVHRDVALEFAKVGEPVVSVFFALDGQIKPVKGVRIWVDSGYTQEREVIAKGSDYKILAVSIRPFTGVTSSYGYRGRTNTVVLLIDLEQMDSVNETNQNKIDSKLLDVLFGDSMRNTAKNLERLSKNDKSS